MEGLAYWFGRFGLGRPTGIGIAETIGHVPGEAGELRHGRIQRAFVTWASGIGQVNVMATPIQMANVAATFARNGIWMRPRLIANAPKLSAYKPRNIGAGDAKDWEDIPDRVDLKLSPEGLAAARKGMINVVNALGGTGTTLESNLQKRNLGKDRLLVAGKTGTAQASKFMRRVRDPETGEFTKEDDKFVMTALEPSTHDVPNKQAMWYRGYNTDGKTLNHAWYIGYAPANNPQIAFAVMVEYGGSGGAVAGPIAAGVLEKLVEHRYLRLEDPKLQ